MENSRKRLLNIAGREASSSSSEGKSDINEVEIDVDSTKSNEDIHEKAYEKITNEKELVDESGRKRGKIVHVDRIIIQKKKKVKEKPEMKVVSHQMTDTISQSSVKKTKLSSRSTTTSDVQSSTDHIIASDAVEFVSNISFDRNTNTSASASIFDKAIHMSSSISSTDKFGGHSESDSTKTSHSTSEQSKENWTLSKDEKEVTKYILKNARGEEKIFEGDPDNLPAGFEVVSCMKLVKKQNEILKNTFTSKYMRDVHKFSSGVTTGSKSTPHWESQEGGFMSKEQVFNCEMIDSTNREKTRKFMSQIPNLTETLTQETSPPSELNQSFWPTEFDEKLLKATENSENPDQEGWNVSEERQEDIKYILRDSFGREETFKGDKQDIPTGFEIVKTIKLVTKRRVVEGNSVTSVKENILNSEPVPVSMRDVEIDNTTLNKSDPMVENILPKVPENYTKKVIEAQEPSLITTESDVRRVNSSEIYASVEGMLKSDSKTDVILESVPSVLKKSANLDEQEITAEHFISQDDFSNKLDKDAEKLFPSNDEHELPKKLIENISDQLKLLSSGESDDSIKKHIEIKKKNRSSWFNWRPSNDLKDESKEFHMKEKVETPKHLSNPSECSPTDIPKKFEKKKKKWFSRASNESKRKIENKSNIDLSDLEENSCTLAKLEESKIESNSSPLDKDGQAPIAISTSPNMAQNTRSLFKRSLLEKTTNESDTTTEKVTSLPTDSHKFEEKKKKKWLGIPVSVSKTFARNNRADVETIPSSEEERNDGQDQTMSSTGLDEKKKRKKRPKEVEKNISLESIPSEAGKTTCKCDEGTSSGLSSLTIDSLVEEKYYDSLNPQISIQVEKPQNKRGPKRSSVEENSSDSSHDHRITKGLSFFKKIGSTSISPSSHRKKETDKNLEKIFSYDVTPSSPDSGGLKNFFSKVTDFVRSNNHSSSKIATEDDGHITGQKYAQITEAQDLYEKKTETLNPEDGRTVEKIEVDGTALPAETIRCKEFDFDAKKSCILLSAPTIKSNSISSAEEFFDSLDAPQESRARKIVDESRETDDDLQSVRTFSIDSIPSYDSDSTSWYPEYKRNQITTTCAYSRKKRPLNKAQYDDRIAVIRG